MRKFILTLIVVLLAACGGDAQSSPTTVPANGGAGAANATATFSPFATAPPELLTPEGAVTAAPTLFAILPETLTTVELHERLDPFASQVCRLPCYGGLVPGEGDVQDVIAFYSQLGIAAIDLAPGDFNDVQADRSGHMRATLLRTTDVLDSDELGLTPPQVDVYVENDVVRYLYVVWQYQPEYLTIQRVISELGEPDRMQMDIGLFAGSEPVYVLTLTYADGIDGAVGFAVVGAFEATENDEAARTLCFRQGLIGSTYLSTFAPGEVPFTGLFDEGLVPAEEGFELSKEELTTRIANDECLTVPAEQVNRLLNN